MIGAVLVVGDVGGTHGSGVESGDWRLLPRGISLEQYTTPAISSSALFPFIFML